MTPAEQFQHDWQDRGYEKGESQQFWLDLLANVFGIQDLAHFIQFENQVHLDHTSFIDGYIPSTKVLIEQKGRDKDLNKPILQSDGSYLTAFQQAKRYAAELPYSQRPRWIVTCNFRSWCIYDMEQPNSEPQTVLLENLHKEVYRLQFLVQQENIHLNREMEVSMKAGEIIGHIYDKLLALYINPESPETLHSLNMLCVRLVFCLYAEDAGIFGRKQLFGDYISQFPAKQIRQALLQLFEVLDTPVDQRDPYLDDDLKAFPYVNGGLFTVQDKQIPQFTDELKELLIRQASDDFDWSEISPTIFGAIFESTLNPETRRAGGMHYTSIENIHKVIDPLFLNDLNAELEHILYGGTGDAGALARGRYATGTSTAGEASAPPDKEITDHCRKYLPHIENKGLQSITFRLYDSLPKEVIQQLKGRIDTDEDSPEMMKLRQKIEELEDAGYGQCFLHNPQVAQIVKDTLLYEDGIRYNLICWCIMPNHVHVLIEVLPDNSLTTILQSWKSVSAHKANKILNRTGDFWMDEYYDRYIRNSKHLRNILEYIDYNPVRAGLADIPEHYSYCSAAYSAGEAPTSPEYIAETITAGEAPASPGCVSTRRPLPLTPKQKRQLLAFQDRLASLRFLDPACGSGNFLTETYLSLRRLENRCLQALLQDQAVFDFFGDRVKVNIHQFYGIEINDFAATVAKTALWIAESQMLHETSRILARDLDFLPLKSYSNIVEGNALTIDWNTVCPPEQLSYIIGNPPFVGARLMSKEQKEDLLPLFVGCKNIGNLDYVGGWYTKAADMMQINPTICAALVSTNSITQGEQPAILWSPLYKKNVHIDFAYRTFRWDSEASLKAHVHCVIIGFSCAEKKDKYIYNESGTWEKADNINPYLINGKDIFVESRSTPLCNVPEIGIGNKPIDDSNYLFKPDEMAAFIAKEPKSEKYFRPWYGSDEFINNRPRYCLWLGDCSPAELRSMPECLKRVENVRNFRLASKSEGTRKLADRPTRFHVENMPETEYIIIPRVSSERRRYIPMGYLQPNCLTSDSAHIIPNATLYHFGILTSNVHMAWMRAVCGRLKSDYRYSKDIVYNNFPWPEVGDTAGEASASPMVAEIERTAQAILDARAEYPDSSLADLYDEVTMPVNLRKAHQANDRAVLRAYGFTANISEPDCVAALFARYEAMTK